MASNKTIIGITGKASCGKSFAGRFFEKAGGTHVDCDKIVKSLYEKEQIGAKKIETFFGDEFIKNGAVNKSKLGRFVAKDEKKLRILEKIIHPVVFSEVQKEIDKSSTNLIFLEITSPSEKFLDICDKTILIEAPDKLRKIKNQYLKDIDKHKQFNLVKPDFVIKNNFDKKTFESRLLKTYNKLRSDIKE